MDKKPFYENPIIWAIVGVTLVAIFGLYFYFNSSKHNDYYDDEDEDDVELAEVKSTSASDDKDKDERPSRRSRTSDANQGLATVAGEQRNIPYNEANFTAPVATRVKISPDNVNFDVNGGMHILTLEYDGMFMCTSEPTWLVGRVEGNQMLIGCEANTTGSHRTGYLMFQYGNRTVKVNLLQYGAENAGPVTPSNVPQNVQQRQAPTNGGRSAGGSVCHICGGSGRCSGQLYHCNGSGVCQFCTGGQSSGYGVTTTCGSCRGTARCSFCNGTGLCSTCHGTGHLNY